MALSGNFAHGDDTTQQVGSGTSRSPNPGMNDTNPPGATMVPDFAGSDETEFQFCFQIRGAGVNVNDTIELRVTDNETAFRRRVAVAGAGRAMMMCGFRSCGPPQPDKRAVPASQSDLFLASKAYSATDSYACIELVELSVNL